MLHCISSILLLLQLQDVCRPAGQHAQHVQAAENTTLLLMYLFIFSLLLIKYEFINLDKSLFFRRLETHLLREEPFLSLHPFFLLKIKTFSVPSD